MYDRILFPTDGNSQANALEHAINITELSGGILHTLSVIDGETVEEDNSPDSFEPTGTQIVEDAETVAAERDVKVSGAIEQGNPDEVILQYITDHDIDLVVMGTHGRSGVDRLVEGSITERIMRANDVPVLAVSIDDDQSSSRERST
ncbi:universal stress protein [Halococcus thailandensis]|uniref:Stress response protein n=1 Tax=Halococcus thailandensis JCM 13552 TaxID=1227457 RepID=M0NE25_9EURY|nr:universal stress protein [Halococcus thailandensis]EMA56081.1 stress response protein [Halococcus thailandensis JCM 13552]